MPSFRSEGSITYPNAQYRPSCSPGDYGPSRGSSLLGFILRRKLPQERIREDGSVPNLKGIWERVVSSSKKEDIQMKVVQKFGALHGQQVVCEGRLNFDYEIRRGSEEGPWADHIPFDGRDVWRFVLIADDSMRNIWHAEPNSFVNLGRNQRNRCWPWSEGNELPFKRPKNDMPLKGHGPQGSLPIHVCKGPFGCNGGNHPHSFQAYAA
eukprot:scaffold251771_cov103-Cyclotella_meneghiniana.AAC.5